ncbi:uncharacterized protein EKO05_0008978 [Ascochyta rabiei]|uniref:uncharacterized protein n=1 Tax=Didymella rabiei TaxID=5454 RepID=UPI001902BF12|nr:uncharacterized protein EKO05_0008978 [Ascochyta rabiei]UPX18686.1 hypothetical protein EKO05_0008978 [Ascochyta rabiei]
MECRGRLTHERLCNSFERLHGAIDAQFPDRKDRNRALDLRRVIEDALTSARAAMSSAKLVSPIQLKRDVEARIVEVHERYNETDEREGHVTGPAMNGVKSEDMHPSALESFFASQNHTTQEPAAPSRSLLSPDSGKENTTPPTAVTQQLLSKKPSAVKKTTIAKRTASKKPSSTITGVKKHISTRRTHNTTKPLPSTTPSQPKTDEADRRAAAAALVGLSDRSQLYAIGATPTPTASTPSPRATKRAHPVYQKEEDVSPVSGFHTGMSAPASKRHIPPVEHAPVPRLDRGMTVQRAFLSGVEYAVHCFASHPSSDVDVVAGLPLFVGQALGMVRGADVGDLNVRSGDGEDGGKVVRDSVGGFASVRSSGGQAGGKGFWDVI